MLAQRKQRPATSAAETTPIAPPSITQADATAAAAVLAHTLLNSLSVIRGGAELLGRHQSRLPQAEQERWFKRIEDHALHMAAVLERAARGQLAEALDASQHRVGSSRVRSADVA